MVFQINALGIFQEDHWYTWHIYLITAFGCPIFQTLEGSKHLYGYRKPVRTQNFRPVSSLSSTCKIFEKVILQTVQRHNEERGLLNSSQFGFLARHSTALQCTRMRLTDHVTLNFNNNKMSTAAVFLDIEKAIDTTWHECLLYKLSTLQFSISLIKPISSFFSQRKFRVSVQNEMFTPRDIQAGMPQGSVLYSTLYTLYINDKP
jgi:hypothetical protein